MNRRTLTGTLLALAVLSLLLGSARRPHGSAAPTAAQQEAKALVAAAVNGTPDSWRDAALTSPALFLRLASE